ncbi:MAG: phytanoyl-CoA dioxygenase family protein [Alphaproteobacteria bacterium]|nr:phytanoyl-CoA dioxygenase family protein [Alphaproteobacteria bacterium]
MAASFDADGFLILEAFASLDSCADLMAQSRRIIDGFDAEQNKVVFSAAGQSHAATEYFINSAGNISCFLEKGAVDENGNLIKDKHQAINKIGHALHDLDPVFAEFSRQPDLALVARGVGFHDPRLLQSMVICKQPFIGGEVNPHQDSTFLYTEPQTCVGFWFALEDATIENGCMWAAPGAHRSELRQRFARGNDGMMEMTTLSDAPMENADVPLDVPAGSLILLHGRLPHSSPENNSGRSRYAYALHLVDGTADYPASNWLQRADDFPTKGFVA